MKKRLFIVCMSFVWTIALMAQQIAVVSGETTHMYKTLQAAIDGAAPGSVIYLPGGGFPISNEVKITKKLTIIGIGHKIHTENPDGYTTISGNLYFDEGSDGSALMGCYVTGTVYIGEDGNKKVDDVLIRCNNITRVWIGVNCQGTMINQNYLRDYSYFNGASADFRNNVAYGLKGLCNGFIANNVLLATGRGSSGYFASICECKSCSITNNVFYYFYGCSSSFFENNISLEEIENNTTISDLNELFVKNVGVTPNSDFHFKEDYVEHEGKVGIYHGTFNDAQLAPVPYIVAKSIPEQTDASGKLTIKIRVKASGEE